MRLTGYACKHPDPPLQRAYVPLGELTVLLGPNDSGKSTLLRAVTRDLQGGHFGDVDEEEGREIGGTFYAEVSDAELDAIIRSSERTRGRRSSGLYEPARRPYDDGLWSVELGEDELEDVEADPRGVLLRKLHTGGRETILEALGASRVVAIECSGRAESIDRLVWNLYWCLPPLAALDNAVAEALRVSDLQPFQRQRERAEGGGRFRGMGMYTALHGTPNHLWADGAPVAVVSLGFSITVPMPKSLAVPADFVGLRGAVSDSATGLITSLVHGPEDAALDGDDQTPEQLGVRRAPRAWLAVDEGWVALSDEASAAFHFVGAAANRRLPGFLTDRYRLVVEIGGIERWFEEEPLRLRVRSAGTGALLDEFAVEEIAEGYRLWVQLALLNALEDTGRLESLARGLASDWFDAETQMSRSGEPSDDELETARDAERRFARLGQALVDFASSGAEWIVGEAADSVDAMPADSWTRGGTRTRRLLVIDEPERHLQPRLQRKAARWLAETSRESHAPMLVATHSPAFLSLPADTTTFVSVHRAGRDVALTRFDIAQLDALSQLSHEMGYDRGELVTAVGLWLVVEGETDKAVLDTLYGDRLRAGGIEVVPLHGTAKWQALLDADALWRFTIAPVAVMFDGIGPTRVHELAAKTDEELEAHARSGSAPNEEKDMARLLRTSRRLGKTVHPVPNDGADILKLLDEAAITSVFGEYPGHDAAGAAWDRHRKGSHDKFLKDRYGVEKSPRFFGAVAELMRTAGATSAVLEAAIAFCEGLAV